MAARKLNEYEVTYTQGSHSVTSRVWVATAAAAREAILCDDSERRILSVRRVG